MWWVTNKNDYIRIQSDPDSFERGDFMADVISGVEIRRKLTPEEHEHIGDISLLDLDFHDRLDRRQQQLGRELTQSEMNWEDDSRSEQRTRIYRLIEKTFKEESITENELHDRDMEALDDAQSTLMLAAKALKGEANAAEALAEIQRVQELHPRLAHWEPQE